MLSAKALQVQSPSRNDPLLFVETVWPVRIGPTAVRIHRRFGRSCKPYLHPQFSTDVNWTTLGISPVSTAPEPWSPLTIRLGSILEFFVFRNWRLDCSCNSAGRGLGKRRRCRENQE